MSDPVRELLAFLVAKELLSVCDCGAPATVWSDRSHMAPGCDACATEHRWQERFGDVKDLKHAPSIRRLLANA